MSNVVLLRQRNRSKDPNICHKETINNKMTADGHVKEEKLGEGWSQPRRRSRWEIMANEPLTLAGDAHNDNFLMKNLLHLENWVREKNICDK